MFVVNLAEAGIFFYNPDTPGNFSSGSSKPALCDTAVFFSRKQLYMLPSRIAVNILQPAALLVSHPNTGNFVRTAHLKAGR